MINLNTNSKLTAQGLTKYYHQQKVVNDFSLHVDAGEIVGLLGPNGAGKTTSFYMIVGLIASDAGEIDINGKKITHSPIHYRASAGLAYLPQEPSIFRNLNVIENIRAILELQKLPKEEIIEESERLINAFDLHKVRDTLGSGLSGGERRRVEIARALASSPKFILLDEPFAGVDPLNIRSIKELIYDLKKRNIGVLITDHNARETIDTCDRIYVMMEGKVLISGNSEEIAKSQLAKQHYLGEDFSI